MNAMTNPLSMFDVKNKVALITGASGAFGMVAARILAGAGCNLVLAAGNQAALDAIAEECRALGAAVCAVNTRPSDEGACQALGDEAVKRRHRVDAAFGADKFKPAHAGGDVGDFFHADGLENFGAVFVARAP